MAIITIARGSYSHGKEIAERVAQRLGYACISRDLLLETSEHFNIPEIKLMKALEDAPSSLERLFTHGKEHYIAYIEATLLEHARKDNMVYHGLAGQFFLKGIKHMLSVRIIANVNDRARLVMEREKVSQERALQLLKKVDEERRRWSFKLYGVDTWEPGLYDLVINVNKLTVDDAVETVCHTAQLPRFKTTPESQSALDDLALAASLKARLIPVVPDVSVEAQKGTVFVNATASVDVESQVLSEIQEIARKMPGVVDVKTDLALTSPRFL